MKNPNISTIAAAGLATFAGNSYLGRFLFAGLTSSGKLTIVYGLTGRSGGSKNRRLVAGEGVGTIKTQVVDPTKETGDPELTIYDAIRHHKFRVGVSNGRQTGDLLDSIVGVCPLPQGSILAALVKREHEPDKPIFTSRISARISLAPSEPLLEIARLSFADTAGTDRACWSYGPEQLPPGYAYGIWTYKENGEPPPPYMGNPVLLPFRHETPDAIADFFWGLLPDDKRAALVVRTVNPDTGSPAETVFRSIHD